ncbi:MAG: DNA repair protein RecN [Chloroflexia bacterium]|nr:DNA repair protein RecN [Chloroflexia bacterium]
MLSELRIRNFAVIKELDMSLHCGLNVLTGETGAGKSIIIDALDLLLGGKADRTMVRTGSDHAEIEGVIALDASMTPLLQPLLAEYGLLGDEDDENLILYREVKSTGRSLGRVNGRAVNIGLLREIGEILVDIHGQSEHLSLFRVRHHLDLLDHYAEVAPLRQQLAQGIAQLRELRGQIRGLEREKAHHAERIDQLNFVLQEIDSAQLSPGEEEALRQERQRLQNGTRLLEVVERLHRILYGSDARSTHSTGGVLDLLGMAAREIETGAQLDPELAPQQELLRALCSQVEDVAHTLRTYRDRLDLDPRRLEEVEERLILIRELERKYGPTIEEVLATAERSRQELEGLTHSEEHLLEQRQQEAELLEHLGQLAGRLSLQRQQAASRLGQAVEAVMADLNMADSTFIVEIERTLAADGLPVDGQDSFPVDRYSFDASGIDRVEFLVSPNPGEEPRPLARIASGGESSRLLLAIKSILSEADATPILIFDEIDVGVGGRSGDVVGEKLWELARHHQVICVTHLPQVAAYAESHISVQKKVLDGRTTVLVRNLQGEGRLAELAIMLAGSADSTVHRESARQIWEQAQQRKALFPA